MAQFHGIRVPFITPLEVYGQMRYDMIYSMYLLVAIFSTRCGKGAPGFSYGDTLRAFFVVNACIDAIYAHNAGSGSGPTGMCFAGGRDHSC